ncbi:ferredoxin [Mycobacterium vicinigordonae]|uniref:Ferredoxin n=1 Tax=Mycobacterium vicinigordonae TaxID=1719132 RepID=A0A7D6E2C6_9MYCO|nr:ferredoxin [Mycobacterium vicinigordonae]
MHLRVDGARCQGHALCYAVDAELFPIDADGYSALSDTTVSDGERSLAERGAAACPERAIEIFDC